jgi:hypothetical protein
MRSQALIPTLFLAVAWILVLIALLSGKNGQMLDLHAIGVSVYYIMFQNELVLTEIGKC